MLRNLLVELSCWDTSDDTQSIRGKLPVSVLRMLYKFFLIQPCEGPGFWVILLRETTAYIMFFFCHHDPLRFSLSLCMLLLFKPQPKILWRHFLSFSKQMPASFTFLLSFLPSICSKVINYPVSANQPTIVILFLFYTNFHLFHLSCPLHFAKYLLKVY